MEILGQQNIIPEFKNKNNEFMSKSDFPEEYSLEDGLEKKHPN